MTTLFAYVGSYTTPERNGRGNGINVYKVDPRSGAFTHVQHLGGLENPSFLAIDRAGGFLYSVHGDRSEATAYAIDRKTGHVAVLNRQSTGGYNPVHLALDPTGSFLAVVNYGSDSLAVLPVGKDGRLGPYATLTPVTGTLGPHRFQQRNMAPHHIPLDRLGRFFYVPCKGSDCVVAYRLDAKRGVLVEAARVTARPSAAPSTSIRRRRWPTSSTNSIRRSRPTARIDAAASSRRCRPSRRRPRTSPATAPAPRSGSIAPAAMSMSPTAATTASASSPSIPPAAPCRRNNGCRPTAVRRVSSPSIPPRTISTSPTRTVIRS